jgi:hypothetical protein
MRLCSPRNATTFAPAPRNVARKRGLEPWAYGMVGMVQAVGDWWMTHGQPMSRPALIDYLTTLLWQGIVGVRAAADIPGDFHQTVYNA